MKKKQKQALQSEVAKFLIDIAKYITTGVVISSFMRDILPFSWVIYMVCTLLALFIFAFGLYFTKKKEE